MAKQMQACAVAAAGKWRKWELSPGVTTLPAQDQAQAQEAAAQQGFITCMVRT